MKETKKMSERDRLPPEQEAALQAFTDVMRAKLIANLHKPGWQGDKLSALLDRLVEETDELREALLDPRCLRGDTDHVVQEAADVANFAMMIADVAGLGAARLAERAEKNAQGKP